MRDKPLRSLGIWVDITERKRQEKRLHLLSGEVNHRCKNMLSIVQSIARQTAATKPHEFIKRFSERVQALAANQDLLVKNGWRGVHLTDLIRSQLAHFNQLIGTRIELRGPEMFISVSAAQTIGMALRELATNAGAFGALSNNNGRVALAWNLDPDAAGKERFTISWNETGGPPVSEPERRGFGLFIVRNVAESGLNGNVELKFRVSGFSWHLSCIANEVLEQGERIKAP
jgi:two-component sensor histidine kinase